MNYFRNIKNNLKDMWLHKLFETKQKATFL